MGNRKLVYLSTFGEDVCFTCHEGLSRDWVDTLDSRLIDQPLPPPHHVANLTTTARRVELNTDPSAYTSGQPSTQAQQYVLRIEDGYLVLPGHWQVGDQVYYNPGTDSEARESCSECHVGNFEVEDDPIRAGIESNSP